MSSQIFGENEEVLELNQKKCIVLGNTGSGKTSLCRHVAALYDYIESESKLTGHSLTKSVKIYKGKYISIYPTDTTSKVQYVMYDSEGFFSNDYNPTSLRTQLYDSLRYEQEINAVIVCLSVERFHTSAKTELVDLIVTMCTLGITMDRVIIVFTHCELYTDERRTSFAKEFIEFSGLDFSMDRVIFGCFMNVDETRPEFQELIGKCVKKSISVIRHTLAQAEFSEPINVASKINSVSQCPSI